MIHFSLLQHEQRGLNKYPLKSVKYHVSSLSVIKHSAIIIQISYPLHQCHVSMSFLFILLFYNLSFLVSTVISCTDSNEAISILKEVKSINLILCDLNCSPLPASNVISAVKSLSINRTICSICMLLFKFTLTFIQPFLCVNMYCPFVINFL